MPPNKEVRTYYYKRYVRVQSSDENVEKTLQEAYKKGTTFVFCPLRVRHDAYEDKRVRDACKIYNRRQVKKVMEVSRKLGIISEFLGKIRVCLSIQEAADGPKKRKAITLYYSRLDTSVDSACSQLAELKKLTIEGVEWTVDGCSGGADRVKYERPDINTPEGVFEAFSSPLREAYEQARTSTDAAQTANDFTGMQ